MPLLARRRRRPLVAATLGLVALVSAPPAAGATANDSIDLTFDWPLECPATVEQETFSEIPGGGSLLIAAAYDVELVDTAAPEDVELRFGTPEITDVLVDDADAAPPSEGTAQYDLMASYVSNPTLAVDLDGASALDIGFDSWLEDSGIAPSDFGRSEDGLRDWVDYRSTWTTWATWVGRWADLGAVASGTVDTEAANQAEFGATSASPLTVEAEPSDDGTVTLRAVSTLDDRAVDELWAYGDGSDPATEVPDTEGDASRVTSVEIVTDPATLQPLSARYDVSLSIDGEVAGAVSHSWTFTWSDCSDSTTVGELPVPAITQPATTAAPAGPEEPGPVDVYVPPGFDTISRDELPPEALDTLELIDQGGPFPYAKDDSVFGNFEGILPDQARGYYREYTVETPGSDDRGARRIVTGEGGEIFYTDDHYESFRVVVP